VSKAIDRLRNGVPLKVERFTIPEGKTIPEIADIIARTTHIKRADFLAAVKRARPPASLIATDVRSLEGLLFPKTYEIVEKASASDVVDMMLSQFQSEIAPLRLRSQASKLGLTPYQIVVLASLVEKEARRADEQPKVASVIYNRLHKGMRLQIDASIQYIFILRTGHPKNPLQKTDYQLQSIYNTYQHDGLPPTPIAAPGLGAIMAALNPANTDFLYYRLCDPNRLALGHIFGRTIQERDREWQRKCA
jgi:UPF0755 protein